MDGCSDIYWTNYTKETAQSWNCPSTKEQICSIIIFGECTVSRPFASKMHVVLPHLLTLQAGVRASDLFQEADLRAACLVAAQHLSPAPSVNSFKLCIWNCTGVISRSVPEWSFFFFVSTSPAPFVQHMQLSGKSWEDGQGWVGARGGGQDLFTLGSPPEKITTWNCTLSRQFDYRGHAPSIWFIHVAQNSNE